LLKKLSIYWQTSNNNSYWCCRSVDDHHSSRWVEELPRMIQIDDDSAAAAATASSSPRAGGNCKCKAHLPERDIHESWWVSQHTHTNNKVRVPRLRRWGNHWTWTNLISQVRCEVQRLRIYIYCRGRGSLHLPNLLTTDGLMDWRPTCVDKEAEEPQTTTMCRHISLLTTYFVFSTTNS